MNSNAIKSMTLDEFQQACKSQGVPHQDMAVVCPMCGTVQSARDLIAAGAGPALEVVQNILGFNCVGRYTGAPTPRHQPDGKPCNWSLGGFFKTHKLEVVTPDGKRWPVFEPATPEQAQQHAKARAREAAC